MVHVSYLNVCLIFIAKDLWKNTKIISKLITSNPIWIKNFVTKERLQNTTFIYPFWKTYNEVLMMFLIMINDHGQYLWSMCCYLDDTFSVYVICAYFYLGVCFEVSLPSLSFDTSYICKYLSWFWQSMPTWLKDVYSYKRVVAVSFKTKCMRRQ